MKIISCMKPVPDPASRLVINEDKTWIKDKELTFVASEADNYALEEALRLKEKHGGEVVVLSLGVNHAARVLRSGLAMGADRAIHLSDEQFTGSDEFATAETIAKAVQADGGADLVLTGVQIRRSGYRNDWNHGGGIPWVRACNGRHRSRGQPGHRVVTCPTGA